MAGWASASAGASDENTSKSMNQNSSYSGTQTPIIDPKYQQAYDKASGNLNGNGVTADQQTAIDFARDRITNSPVRAAVTSGNAALAGNSNAVGANNGQLQTNQGAYDSQGAALQDYSNYWKNASTAGSYTLGNLAAKAAAGTPGYESYAAPKDLVAGQVTADKVAATQGSKYMGDYQSPYTNDVVNTTLANYDQNTKNQLASLRASRDSGSAFGDRANLGDGSYLNQSDLTRAGTEASLRDKAFTTAAGYGMQDADRFLTADSGNADRALSAATGNVDRTLSAGEFNNNLLNNRQQFDVGAAYQGDARRDAAVTSGERNIGQMTDTTKAKDSNLVLQANNLKTMAGLTQQQIDNVVTADGVDTNAATALFQAGQITQGQLNQILAAASTFNGTSASGTQNTNGTSNSNTVKVDAKASFGI